jgi:uncharacterized membrane protein
MILIISSAYIGVGLFSKSLFQEQLVGSCIFIGLLAITCVFIRWAYLNRWRSPTYKLMLLIVLGIFTILVYADAIVQLFIFRDYLTVIISVFGILLLAWLIGTFRVVADVWYSTLRYFLVAMAIPVSVVSFIIGIVLALILHLTPFWLNYLIGFACITFGILCLSIRKALVHHLRKDKYGHWHMA